MSDASNIPPVDLRMVGFFGQAWSLLAASQLRYWARAADAWSRLVPDVMRSAAPPPDPARAAEIRAALIDALRTGFGEMIELQVAEARRIETELTDLARRTWPGSADEDAGGFTRRWTVKE
jgi:hypothetical protein